MQGPFYTTMTVIGPSQYGSYYVDAHRSPVSNGKSPEPLQERAYGQPKRARDHFHQQTRALIPGTMSVAQPYNRYPYSHLTGLPGQVRAAIRHQFQYQFPNLLISRARMPVFKRIVTSPPNPKSLPGQVYYRNAIPKRQASFVRLAHGALRGYGYPPVKRVGRAVVNRRPQPRTLMTSLTAAAARLVAPARPEAYENSATAESVWSAAASQEAAHAVR